MTVATNLGGLAKTHAIRKKRVCRRNLPPHLFRRLSKAMSLPTWIRRCNDRNERDSQMSSKAQLLHILAHPVAMEERAQ
jgi:hypothetical protein